VASHYGLSDDYVKKGPVILNKSSIDQETIEGNVVIVREAQKDKRIQYPEKVKKEGIGSIISVPLKTKSHILGELKCYTRTGQKFSDEDMPSIVLLADQAAVAIENMKTLDRNKSLLELSKMVNSSLKLEEVLTTTVKLVTEAMGVKACTIRLHDERQNKMVLKGAYGLSDAFLVKGPYDVDELPIDQEVLKDKTVYIPQITKDSRFNFPDFAQREGIVSLLAVPLKAMERVLGTLRVYTGTEYEYSENETNFLLTLANQAAIAVNNAILYERLHTLYLVSSSLTKSLDMHQVFKTIVEGATVAMNAQGCALLMWDQEENVFHLAQSYGISPNFMRTVKDKYINCTREILCGETVLECRLDDDHRHSIHQIAMEEGISSFMNIPMKAKEHLTGILQIYFTTQREFPPHDVEFITALANEASVAIENAKLYEHINKKYNNLVEDIFLWYDGTNRGMDY